MQMNRVVRRHTYTKDGDPATKILVVWDLLRATVCPPIPARACELTHAEAEVAIRRIEADGYRRDL